MEDMDWTYHPKPAGQVVHQPVDRLEDRVQEHVEVAEGVEAERLEEEPAVTPELLQAAGHAPTAAPPCGTRAPVQAAQEEAGGCGAQAPPEAHRPTLQGTNMDAMRRWSKGHMITDLHACTSQLQRRYTSLCFKKTLQKKAVEPLHNVPCLTLATSQIN